MQQGRLLRISAYGLVLVLVMLAVAVSSASAASTGGVTAPSTGSSGTAVGGTVAQGHTGGISPSTVRPPSAPVKKKRKKKRTRRHSQHHPAPAPAPAPAPTPAPAPAPPPAAGSTADVPVAYLALYRAAGRSAGIDWRILAAIGKNESDHGRSTAPGVASGRNYADCCSGPMQLCTVASCSKVWQFYAADANGDGVASVYDPADAIYAAAKLVRDLKGIVGDDPRLLLAAYNAGPGNVRKYKGVPPFPETQAYVRAGLAYIAQLG